MNEFDFECRDCGTTIPVELVSEQRWEGDEYPPSSVESICGRRWGGCGDVAWMDRVEANDE